MNDTLKKIILWVLAGALAAGVGFGIYYLIDNLPALLADGKLATQKQVEDAYQNGYVDGRDGFPELVYQLDEALAQIETLQAQAAVYQNEIDSAANALLQSQLSNESKQQLIEEMSQNIINLTQYINELNDMIIALQAENTQLKAYVALLEEQRDNLLQSVYALEQALAAYELIDNQDYFSVTFMFNDQIYLVELIPNGETVTIETPPSTDHIIFHGWSDTQGGDLIDLSAYPITQTTIFYAILTVYYDVDFYLEGVSYTTLIIEKGNSVNGSPLTSITNPDIAAPSLFSGWSLDNSNITDIDTYPIYEHTIFFAVIDYKYNVTFVSAGSPLTSIVVNKGGSATAMSGGTRLGFIFNGWSIDGVSVINPITYPIYNHTTFTALWTAYKTGTFVLDDWTLVIGITNTSYYATIKKYNHNADVIPNLSLISVGWIDFEYYVYAAPGDSTLIDAEEINMYFMFDDQNSTWNFYLTARFGPNNYPVIYNYEPMSRVA